MSAAQKETIKTLLQLVAVVAAAIVYTHATFEGKTTATERGAHITGRFDRLEKRIETRFDRLERLFIHRAETRP